MNTADLFESIPIVRRRDPVTSHEAAERYATKRIADVDLMFELIRQHPGGTAGEYSQLLKDQGMFWLKAARMPTRRISDLVKAERLNIGESRKCGVTGECAQTYYVRLGQ